MKLVEGTDDIYEVTPAPGTVTDEGTFINKVNLLKDTTAALYGFTEDQWPDVVPDDVLKTTPFFSWQEVTRFATAGSYTWTSDFDGTLGVLVVGGGGSGASQYTETTSSSSSASTQTASGGASGYAESGVVKVQKNTKWQIVVGAGGTSVSDTASGNGRAGIAGGSSAFSNTTYSITANGGSGGVQQDGHTFGGQPVLGAETDGRYGTSTPDLSYNSDFAWSTILKIHVWKNVNPFTGEEILGSGGSARVNNTSSGSTTVYVGGKNPLTGLGGGDGAAGYRASAKGEDATMFGCGGGGCCAGGTSSAPQTAVSGAGADGIVILYRKQEVSA